MVRVDASRRVTSSAETETAFSFADAFFVGTVGIFLVFALVAISKCLWISSKTNKGETRAFQHRSRDRTFTRFAPRARAPILSVEALTLALTTFLRVTFSGASVTVCYFVRNSKYSSMNDVTGGLDLPDFLPLRLSCTYGHHC